MQQVKIDNRTHYRGIYKRLSEWMVTERDVYIAPSTLAARVKSGNPETIDDYIFMQDLMDAELEKLNAKIAKINQRKRETV